MERRVKLKTINPHITCKICGGYFIDATTVTECLHTCEFFRRSRSTTCPITQLFPHLHPHPKPQPPLSVCKSCLVKHLEEKKTCPTCDNIIHQSHPLQYISFDRTMQDIVYKLVPKLQEGWSGQASCFHSPPF